MSKTTRMLMKDDENLLQICLDLRMSSCGSSDPLIQEIEERYIKILKSAIENWEEGLPRYKDFDDCVLNLCKATLKEINNDRSV